VQSGQVKLSFDSFGTGDELPGLEASVLETESVVIYAPGATTTSSRFAANVVRDKRERLTFNVTAEKATGADDTVFWVRILDQSNATLWEESFTNADFDTPESHVAPRIHLTGEDVGLDVGDYYKLEQEVVDGEGSSTMSTSVVSTRAITVPSARVRLTLASSSWTSQNFTLSTPDQFEIFNLDAYKFGTEPTAEARVRLYDGNDNLLGTWTEDPIGDYAWVDLYDIRTIYPYDEGVSLGESYYYKLDWTSGRVSRFRGTIESSKILTGIIRKT
jgi:hypothetical protein